MPIAYGWPKDETVELARQGLVILGGCDWSEGAPKFGCQHCRAPFSPLEMAAE